jgi:hypothetical protein
VIVATEFRDPKCNNDKNSIDMTDPKSSSQQKPRKQEEEKADIAQDGVDDVNRESMKDHIEVESSNNEASSAEIGLDVEVEVEKIEEDVHDMLVTRLKVQQDVLNDQNQHQQHQVLEEKHECHVEDVSHYRRRESLSSFRSDDEGVNTEVSVAGDDVSSMVSSSGSVVDAHRVARRHSSIDTLVAPFHPPYDNSTTKLDQSSLVQLSSDHVLEFQGNSKLTD